MKVLHLATSLYGGAGIAALRLADAQRQIGLDATVISQASGRILEFPSAWRVSPLRRFSQRATTLVNRALSRRPNTFYSPHQVAAIDAQFILERQPDVVHVHNWYNLFSWQSLDSLRSAGIKVVASLHDERLLTGGCHNTMGCEHFNQNCPRCPQSRLSRLSAKPSTQLNQMLRKGQVHLVSPSRWLGRRATMRFGGEVDVSVIPNCLDSSVFFPASALVADRSITIGILTQKAPALLRSTLGQLESLVPPGSIAVHFAGSGPRPAWAGPSRDFGKLLTEVDRATFWRGCDVALLPTLADNFPNVNVEAVLSGTYPVTCRLGGAAEVIDDTEFGSAVLPDASSLADAVVHAVLNAEAIRERSGAARQRAQSLYDAETVALRFKNLYDEDTA